MQFVKILLFFPIAVVYKADTTHQNFTPQIFPNPQFVKIFHCQNFVPYSLVGNITMFGILIGGGQCTTCRIKFGSFCQAAKLNSMPNFPWKMGCNKKSQTLQYHSL